MACARFLLTFLSLSFFCTLAALLRSLLSWGRNRGLRESGAATLTERIDSGPLTRDVNLSCEFYKSRSQAGAQLFVQLLYDVHEIKINLWRQFLPPNELEHAEFKRSDPKNTAEGTCVTPTRWKWQETGNVLLLGRAGVFSFLSLFLFCFFLLIDSK